MACVSAPCGVSSSEAEITSYSIPNKSGNEVYNIPRKIGEPLSSACERATTVGSIPEVIHMPNYSIVSGRVAQRKPSNGGFTEAGLANFLNRRSTKGCYGNISLYGSSCK